MITGSFEKGKRKSGEWRQWVIVPRRPPSPAPFQTRSPDLNPGKFWPWEIVKAHAGLYMQLNRGNVISEHPVALYRYDLGASVPSKCNVVRCSFVGHYMFRPNRPSSGVQVVVVKDSAAHPIVVASPYNATAEPQRRCSSVCRGSNIVGKKTALQWAAESLTTTTCTPEDGQLGRNMQCSVYQPVVRDDGTGGPQADLN
jgi:hypothetical protein